MSVRSDMQPVLFHQLAFLPKLKNERVPDKKGGKFPMSVP